MRYDPLPNHQAGHKLGAPQGRRSGSARPRRGRAPGDGSQPRHTQARAPRRVPGRGARRYTHLRPRSPEPNAINWRDLNLPFGRKVLLLVLVGISPCLNAGLSLKEQAVQG